MEAEAQVELDRLDLPASPVATLAMAVVKAEVVERQEPVTSRRQQAAYLLFRMISLDQVRTLASYLRPFWAFWSSKYGGILFSFYLSPLGNLL
jgi:hypothetical protein